MIVEVFVRGTTPAFSQHVTTYHAITNISVIAGNFVLTVAGKVVDTLVCAKYELRVTY